MLWKEEKETEREEEGGGRGTDRRRAAMAFKTKGLNGRKFQCQHAFDRNAKISQGTLAATL